MRSSFVAAALAVLSFSSASPVSQKQAPLPFGRGGIPNAKQLAPIIEIAGGGPPDNAPPTVSKAGTANFELIAFVENLESVMFKDLLSNITHEVEGYKTDDFALKDILVKTITKIAAEEIIHSVTAENVLQNIAKVDIIQPCKYKFPVSDLKSALELARDLTDAVIGTLQDAAEGFAKAGDHAFAATIVAVTGMEGAQEGFFRISVGDETPTKVPFETSNVAIWGFNALMQNFVVPGSCPNPPKIRLLTPLVLDTKLKQGAYPPETIEFSFDPKAAKYNGGKLYIGYNNQRNLPVIEEVKIIGHGKGQAKFPRGFNGFVVSGLVTSNKFTNIDDLANASIAGPMGIHVS